jgi:hypothetical protein
VELAVEESMPYHICSCTRCGHSWKPRRASRPVFCPRCRSKEWGGVVAVEVGPDDPEFLESMEWVLKTYHEMFKTLADR